MRGCTTQRGGGERGDSCVKRGEGQIEEVEERWYREREGEREKERETTSSSPCERRFKSVIIRRKKFVAYQMKFHLSLFLTLINKFLRLFFRRRLRR